MSANKFTLASIRDAADAKYAATEVELENETVTLVNVLRLPKEKRAALVAVQERMKEEDADQVELLHDALRAAAKNTRQADALIAEVGDDLAVLVELFSSYTEGTQAGEA